MKKFVLIAAVAALSACNNKPAEPTASDAAPAAAEAGSSMAGTYDYTYEGKATTSVLKADGTYEDTQGGKVIESGTWSEQDGMTCFDDTGDNPEQCWSTTEPDADGNFAATSADGKTVLQIRKTA